jgi:hypothetical protein
MPGRASRLVARGRAIPWVTVLEVLRRLKLGYDALTPRERAEVRELLRKARAERGRLGERDRRRAMALGRKAGQALARRR